MYQKRKISHESTARDNHASEEKGKRGEKQEANADGQGGIFGGHPRQCIDVSREWRVTVTLLRPMPIFAAYKSAVSALRVPYAALPAHARTHAYTHPDSATCAR